LQTEFEREVAEQRAMEKRLRQLDEAEAKAARAAEALALKMMQDEERRFAAEERQLEAAEARLAKERADWDRDRTPPPRIRIEATGEDQRDEPWVPPSQQEEHAAATKLQANYRGHAVRRDMNAEQEALGEQGRRLQAEREAREQQTRMELAELERSTAMEATRAPAPVVAQALARVESTAETDSRKSSAIERARQRRAMKGTTSPVSSVQRPPADGGLQQQPRLLHYATSLNTPSKRVTIEEFADALTSGEISATSVVIWTKGMASWKMPSDALDVFPELTPVFQRNGPTLAEKRRMVLEARAGASMAAGGEALREQLQGLKVMSLFKKATAAGVAETEIEVRRVLHH
jgi:hypothetical protein